MTINGVDNLWKRRLFNPLYSGLYLGEFNIDTGTEINHAIDLRDLHDIYNKEMKENDNLFSNGDCDNINKENTQVMDQSSEEELREQNNERNTSIQDAIRDKVVSRQFQLLKPSLSLILPDGAHQVIQDSFLNILPIGEWTTSTSTSNLQGNMEVNIKQQGANSSWEDKDNSSSFENNNESMHNSLRGENESISGTTNEKSSNLENATLEQEITSPNSLLSPISDTHSVISQTSESVKLFGYLVYKQMQKMNMKRNARVKALMFVSNSKSCIYLKNALFSCLNEVFAVDFLEEGRTAEEKDTLVREILISLLKSITELEITKSDNLLQSPRVSVADSICFSDVLERRQYTTLHLNFRTRQYPLKICQTIPPNSIDSEDVSIVKLIDMFQEKIMLLFNCILYERKCVFLAHNLPASLVANSVLASALMIPLLPEKYFLLKRFFPYASFLEMDEILPVSGFVIGTTNPIFLERSEWYDCLCNLNTGAISISCPEQMIEVVSDDHNFIQNIMQLIAQMRRNPKNTSSDIENIIQSHFRQYALDIYRGALFMDMKKLPNWDEFDSIDQKSKPRLMPDISKAYTFKLHLLRKTRSYRIWKKIRESKSRHLTMDVDEDLLLLRNAKYELIELLQLYGKWIKNVKSREQVVEFLNFFPESRGGLESVFIPLLHESELVRFMAMTFIQQLERYKEGSYAISKCNFFLVLCYHQCQKTFLEYEK